MPETQRIEKVDFELGQLVRFVLAPTLKGQIVSIEDFADGGRKYCVNWFSDEGLRSAWFFACEIEADTE